MDNLVIMYLFKCFVNVLLNIKMFDIEKSKMFVDIFVIYIL